MFICQITNIDADQNRCTGEEKEQLGSSIPTSVSMLVKPSNLSYSAMTLRQQMNKKAFLGEGELKSIQSDKFLISISHFLTENLELQNKYPLVMKVRVINAAT